jgi:hypothetical protein
MKNIQNNQDGVVRYKVTLFDGEGQHTLEMADRSRSRSRSYHNFDRSFFGS